MGIPIQSGSTFEFSCGECLILIANTKQAPSRIIICDRHNQFLCCGRIPDKIALEIGQSGSSGVYLTQKIAQLLSVYSYLRKGSFIPRYISYEAARISCLTIANIEITPKS